MDRVEEKGTVAEDDTDTDSKQGVEDGIVCKEIPREGEGGTPH